MNARQNLRKRIRRAEHRLAEFNGVDIGDTEKLLLDVYLSRTVTTARQRLQQLQSMLCVMGRAA